jgi:multidrug transporter EmrE-like cation transporter
MVVQGVVIPAYAVRRRRGETLALLRPFAALGLFGALLSVSAYGLVLWAQTRAELAPVAALRESSIIVGAAIGALFFKERFGAPRIAAAGLLVVGIGLMLHAGQRRGGVDPAAGPVRAAAGNARVWTTMETAPERPCSRPVLTARIRKLTS